VRYLDVAGVHLSKIGVGTWQFGSREWGYGSEYARIEAVRIVRRALDLGVNLLDTAEIYGFGQSEHIVGRAIADRRDEAFIATKVFPLFPTPAVVEWRAKASARRLGIAAIDLYQIHQHNPFVPMRIQMEGMRRLVDEGVVHHVGVSNFSLARWQSAEAELGNPVLSDQVRLSLVDRGALLDLVPWAAAHERLVIAYSPLGQGLLSARYDSTNPPRHGVRAMNAHFLPENINRARNLFDLLRDLAKTHDAEPAQIALAWVIRLPNVVAIPGARTVEQLEANVAAAEIELSADEITRLMTEAEAFRPLEGPAAFPKLLRRRLA
jgi:aryl-alcohol dehydrogenase-like predicted oxidoreductase